MGEATASTSVCVAYKGSNDFYSLSDTGSVVESAVEAAWRLTPGETAKIGSQGIRLARPDPSRCAPRPSAGSRPPA